MKQELELLRKEVELLRKEIELLRACSQLPSQLPYYVPPTYFPTPYIRQPYYYWGTVSGEALPINGTC